MVRRLAAAGVCLVGIGAGTTACGGEPAVCEDIDALRASVSDLQEIQVGNAALPALSTQLDEIQADLAQLGEDTSEEYSSQVDTVRTRTAALQSSLEVASTSQSTAAWADVAADVRAVGSAVTELGDAVADTCE